MASEAPLSSEVTLTPTNAAAELPITARRDEIVAALGAHQVLIVAGDTGSGKSTQLPQYCLLAGRGSLGLIAHTQPRRLAARALAARVAEEREEAVGATIGFRVRFTDQVSAATRLVLMTDGLLLAESSNDPLLSRYDTIIVDEAHERSLNVDLLLGVLKRVLARRPDLKVIVTSATLDVERISAFFGRAPIITVSGRSYPIEVRYVPQTEDLEDPDLAQAVLAGYAQIAAEPGAIGKGDVLVFLPGEREIRDVGEALERDLKDDVEILPLYSRLSWDQQSKIFLRGKRRRIVLATNVAETSITVPGIRAVIDTGLARISRYSPRSRLQRLPIEPVSRASADQRKGRCGRLGSGLCIRLYSQLDFDARAAFTEPEILRTNLAALLLRLAADGLGAAESFPFIDAPDSRSLGDGYRLLQELEALDEDRRITRLGRAMARLPLDPRLARALLEAKRFRAEAELLAITAGLSVPDARLAAKPGTPDGDDATAVFEDGRSEFTALYKLWRAYRKAREGPRRELRRWCKEKHLSLLRLSEWDDVYNQVSDRAKDLGIVAQRQPASYTAVHRALLAGFCTMVGSVTEEGDYVGTRGVHFHIFPGSPLKRRKPRWVMAANIVETSRVYARRVAQVEPNWIEAAAQHLLKREFLEPDWNESREQVTARERISLLGLILSADRIVNYGPIDPETSRRIFAREALVYHRLRRRPDWLRFNDDTLQRTRLMEERLRTRDLVVPPEALVDFYDQALPRQVSSAMTLDNFTRHLTDTQRAALTLSEADVLARVPDAAVLSQFPERTAVATLDLPVAYRFEPGEARDGATLSIPLLVVPTLTRTQTDAAVPGYLKPRIEALLRSLPKDARRALIPIADTAAAYVSETPDASTDPVTLGAWLHERHGIPETLLRFDSKSTPRHLVPQFAVVDGGREIAQGENLADLRIRCAARARIELERAARQVIATPWRRFELVSLEPEAALETGSGLLTVYPAVSSQLMLQYEWTRVEAAHVWRFGAVRLARLILERQARDLEKTITRDTPLLLAATPYMTSAALSDLLLQWSFERACFKDAPAPRLRDAFDAAVEAARSELHAAIEQARSVLQGLLGEARVIRSLLDDPRTAAYAEAAAESRLHIARLLHPDVLGSAEPDWLRQLPRYLKAQRRRWERLQARGTEAAQVMREIEHWTLRRESLQQRVSAQLRWLPQMQELGWWIEEYRVSLYAQELKTRAPISAGRLQTRAAEIEAWLAR